MEKIWKEVKKIDFTTCEELLKEFKKNNFKISPWLEDIVKKNKYKFANNKFPIKLVRKYVKDLGFSAPVELQMIYKKIEELGYSLVPPEIAIYSRSLYKDQPTGEWLRFATPLNSMIDSDGVPHLPKIGKALGFYFIETYWSYPKAIFHPHNDFIMVIK
jgi:hypothetical protein